MPFYDLWNSACICFYIQSNHRKGGRDNIVYVLQGRNNSGSSRNIILRGEGFEAYGKHTHDVNLPGHTHAVSGQTAQSGGTHTHPITYSIAEGAYTTSDIKVYTTDDAEGSPSWTERTADIETALGRVLNSGDEEVEISINLASYFTGTGWKGIKIEPNGDSRHKVQANVKCFIESK